ncbi:uncharacterized protein VTP21DRAFT_10331 [Calcarisporiella thermophila]|uniref:uncharacterized protein n=1 Tax=Calcarisporiella thermophila TaxID=911321 RepID=UPI003743C219
MGLCLSAEEKKDRERSLAIDRQIDEDNKKLRKECKILLLGSGESGKSTIVKQMKIIHLDGYSENERIWWRIPIYKNVHESIQAIIMALEKFGLKFDQPENEEHANYIMGFQINSSQEFRLTPEFVEAVECVWKDSVMEKLLERQSDFYLMDSAPYFVSEIRRLGAIDYIPTQDDVLRARLRSTGITETRFNIGQLNIHLFDVGGQRSERKKWIHCFECVTSIIFCVALSEYDQVLLEESAQNRMVESLVLFESVINSRWFLRSSVILFLNKFDIFKQKLPRVPLSRYFPDYYGGADVSKAIKYIAWRFSSMNRARLNIYPHVTTAIDSSNIRLVFVAVKETILQNALKDSGIL